MRKLVPFLAFVGIGFTVVGLIYPTEYGSPFQTGRADLMCYGAVGLLLVPSRHVVKGAVVLTFIMGIWFAYSILQGWLSMLTPAEASGVDNAIRLPLMLAIMASCWRCPDAQGRHFPVLARAISVCFIVAAFVPYVMEQHR